MQDSHGNAPRGTVSIDGQRVPVAEARISVLDRGFLFGDSAFEVMRTYGGAPFRQDAHLRRLARSCQRLLIPLPVELEALADEIAATVRDSGLPDAYVRVMVTRGGGPPGIAIDEVGPPVVLVYALPLRLPPPAAYADGIAVGLIRVGRATDGTGAEGAKASNYLGSVLAVNEVRRRGAAEAIIVGQGGQVIEGATSNIFVIRGDALHTPPVGAGILEGITRATVLQQWRDAGRPVVEDSLHPQDLYAADEVFITSTVREVMPVVRVDDVQIGAGKPGQATLELLARYREQAHRHPPG